MTMNTYRAMSRWISAKYSWMGVVIALAIVCAIFAGRGLAQTEKISLTKPAEARPAAAAPAAAHELTAADVEAFLDGFLPKQLERDDMAGAVVSIVKDGKVLFSRGYGYSDVEKKKGVSADDTLFRPGSVTKLFTCTAVMQLVEQGKLDLDKDVNEYLDFKIPATYAQPVTLRRIMTHTAGFEEWGKELFVTSAADLEQPSVYLPKHLPVRIFAPGTVPAYSNYAMSVAGYIVQRVSGERFEDYVANHIYKPLGMVHSTFVQPLPADLQPLMSNGYQLASSPAKPFEFVNGAPAGSMSTTGADMARFAIAHLQDGRYGDAQILRPETARLMHSRTFGPAAELNGMALAFFQEDQNGHKIIGHGGDTAWFHSHLHLVLDANVGLFISYNSRGRGDLDPRGLLWDQFLDRYFPAAPPLPPAIATAASDAKTYAGNYLSSRRGETTITKLGAYLGEVTISAKPDGTIVTDQLKGVNGQPTEWREIAPGVYRDTRSEGKIAFKRDTSGNLVVFSDFAAFAFQPATGTEKKGIFMFIMVFPIVIFALTILLWPVSALVRRHYKQPLNLDGSALFLRRLTRIVCLLDLAVIGGWFGVFAYGLGDIGRLNHHLDPWFHLVQVAGWIGVIGTILVIVNAARTLFGSNRWGWSKLFECLIALASLSFCWFLYTCNFLHFGLKY
jgi:CubicO group peptidase (beta-lactamase class C family)